MTDHSTIDQLSDYVDGALGPGDAAAVDRHVHACARCARDLARLRALLAAAAALPRVVEPPATVWPAIRASLEARKVASLPSVRARTAPARAIGTPWMIAATVLVVASGAVAVGRNVARESSPRVDSAARVSAASGSTLAAAAIERRYAPTLDELAASLRAANGPAPRKSIPAVDRSLRIVDSAIAETRAALVRDPGNREIADLLSANYEKKLDLLKRASELTSEQ